MRKLAVPAVVAAILASQGCYLGHNKTLKTVAVAVDSAVVVGGIVIAATPDPANCFCIVNHADVGAVPIAFGLIGLLINAMTSTSSDPAPTAVVDYRSGALAFE